MKKENNKIYREYWGCALRNRGRGKELEIGHCGYINSLTTVTSDYMVIIKEIQIKW